MDGFISSGVKAIRVGFEGKSRPELEEYLLETQFEKHALKPEFDDLTAKLKKTSEDMIVLADEVFKLEKEKTMTPNLKGRVRKLFTALSMMPLIRSMA